LKTSSRRVRALLLPCVAGACVRVTELSRQWPGLARGCSTGITNNVALAAIEYKCSTASCRQLIQRASLRMAGRQCGLARHSTRRALHTGTHTYSISIAADISRLIMVLGGPGERRLPAPATHVLLLQQNAASNRPDQAMQTTDRSQFPTCGMPCSNTASTERLVYTFRALAAHTLPSSDPCCLPSVHHSVNMHNAKQAVVCCGC
jgi:hypothetical protein